MKLSLSFKAPGFSLFSYPKARPTKVVMKLRIRNVFLNILVSIFSLLLIGCLYHDKCSCFVFELMLIYDLWISNFIYVRISVHLVNQTDLVKQFFEGNWFWFFEA